MDNVTMLGESISCSASPTETSKCLENYENEFGDTGIDFTIKRNFDSNTYKLHRTSSSQPNLNRDERNGKEIDDRNERKGESQDIKLNNNNQEPNSGCTSEITIPTDIKTDDWRNPEFHFGIGRDYSGKNCNVMGIRFLVDFPLELSGSVSKEVYENTIEKVNGFFEKAEELGWSSALESILWLFTCTLMSNCKKTRMEKALDNVRLFLFQQNNTIYHPLGLHFVNPLANGLRQMVVRNISSYGLYKNGKLIRAENPVK